MRSIFPDRRWTIFAYYAFVILVGTIFLLLPWSQGPGGLAPVDALFLATSAVSVTGLATVPLSTLSDVGRGVMLILIQLGGLGLVTLALMALARRDARVRIHDRKLLGDYFLPGVDSRPLTIAAKVAMYAFAWELAGALALVPGFIAHGVPEPVGAAVFHAVSAFCNAGFSTFDSNLEAFVGRPAITGVMAILVVVGGLGFVVHDDIRHRLYGKTKRLKLHSLFVLGATALALAVGTVAFLVLEWGGSMAGLDPLARIWESVFMAVAPRTAGFDTIAPSTISAPSQFLTMVLMLVGGAPASTAGGLKVTTVGLLLLAVWRGLEGGEDVGVGRRRIEGGQVARAAFLVVRMAIVLALAVMGLLVAEVVVAGRDTPALSLVFEAVSAFCTVGLSLGVTADLSDLGKLLVVLTMYGGRVGLLALAMPQTKYGMDRGWKLPKEEIMLG